ncbi:MAG: D-tagatose-bisphosphate aldolase, class II, non-catalytic subunit [candidate division KSB1 bacterium]|nr:D-tagatose-bisphosphate aldolase, class II, non-catalytic subunit [candidate division KSB1 bacterium]
MAGPDPLREIVGMHKGGKAVGIYAVCSAHPFVLEAAVQQAVADGSFLLVESTSNQVDQFGGYTGMTPAHFAAFVRDVAERYGLPHERVILGGDHLGPNVWRNQPADRAMRLAKDQIRAYVHAGYRKIHLDTTMRCADDPGSPDEPLDPEIVARRSAELCNVAEEAALSAGGDGLPPVYVVGTEVPPPGGATGQTHAVEPTRLESLKQTVEVTRKAFLDRKLEAAWKRVVAVVVQPGIEFSDMNVIDYDRQKVTALKEFIAADPQLVFEAHSTDYQTTRKLREMVEDHFVILKVGPALTFAFREAVFALEAIEKEWVGRRKGETLSDLANTVTHVMLENPKHWEKYYRRDEEFQRLSLTYSYSDRIRYYWSHPDVQRSLRILMDNLTTHPAPLNLISYFLPNQYRAIREGVISNNPRDIIHHKIREVLERYSEATRTATVYCT